MLSQSSRSNRPHRRATAFGRHQDKGAGYVAGDFSGPPPSSRGVGQQPVSMPTRNGSVAEPASHMNSSYDGVHGVPWSKSGPAMMPNQQEDEEDVKRQLLVDIEAKRVEGHHIRRFTMHDDRADMEFELRKIEMETSERETVGMMRDGLKLALTGVELANTKLSLLDLEGWSAEVTRDMDKYNSALSRLYRKYCKRGTSRPEMELALAILSSMIMFHVRRKFIGRSMGGLGAGVGVAMNTNVPTTTTRVGHAQVDPLDDDASTQSSEIAEGPPPF